MQDNKKFFASLKEKVLKRKQKQKPDEKDVLNQKEIIEKTTSTDNEWLQEYELIYSSYSIDGY
jgi:hypothetical protein